MQPSNRLMSEDEMSEQCCVLNVWTTDLTARKPVMFWLHGGGFDSGTSAWDPGMCLAKKDVVVVSINHRLNILGLPGWQPYTKENGELMVFGGRLPYLRHNHDRKLEEIIDRHCFKQLDAFRASGTQR